MNNNIDSILMMMEEMLDSAWSIPMSHGKCMVDVDKFRELVEDIRLHLPVEISKAQEIVNDRKIILDDAKKAVSYTHLDVYKRQAGILVGYTYDNKPVFARVSKRL